MIRDVPGTHFGHERARPDDSQRPSSWRPNHSRELCGRALDPATEETSASAHDGGDRPTRNPRRRAIPGGDRAARVDGAADVRVVRAARDGCRLGQGSVAVNEVQMWVGGQLVVKGPKTESGVHTIPIPTWLLDALRKAVDHRAQRAGEPVLATDRLFTSPTGKPILDHTLGA